MKRKILIITIFMFGSLVNSQDYNFINNLLKAKNKDTIYLNQMFLNSNKYLEMKKLTKPNINEWWYPTLAKPEELPDINLFFNNYNH